MSTGKLNFFKKVQFSRAIRRIVLSHFPLLRSYFLLISGAPSMPALVQLFVQARPLHLLGMVALQFSRAIRRIVLTHSPLRCSYFCSLPGAPFMPARTQLFVQARPLHLLGMTEL